MKTALEILKETHEELSKPNPTDWKTFGEIMKDGTGEGMLKAMETYANQFKEESKKENHYTQQSKFVTADYIPIIQWRFISSNILPEREGRYLVFDKFGNVDICLYANSGYASESTSFFEGHKKIVQAKNIVAWTDLELLK